MHGNMVRVFAGASARGNAANWYEPLDTECMLDA